MKHYHLLFYVIFIALIHNADHAEGFIANTIVTASKGNTFISHIKPKDFVIVNNNNNCCRKHKNYSRVQRVHQYLADKYIKITIDDTAICCAPNQKFYCVKNNRWIEAQYLTHDNHLICADSSTVTVDKIEFINKPTTVYALTVKKHHIYCIEPHKIIAHNYGEPLMSAPFIIASSVSTAASAACSTIAAIFSIPAAPALLTVGSAASVIIAGAAIYFAQKQKQRNPTFTEIQTELRNGSNSSSPKKPDDDDEYPHGRYEDAPYHHRNSGGEKNPCPDNGQLALDYSIPSVNKQRIAIEGEMFIVLKRTAERLYHGYKVPWEQLHPRIQTILKKAGLVLENGKIIKRIVEKSLK